MSFFTLTGLKKNIIIRTTMTNVHTWLFYDPKTLKPTHWDKKREKRLQQRCSGCRTCYHYDIVIVPRNNNHGQGSPEWIHGDHELSIIVKVRERVGHGNQSKEPRYATRFVHTPLWRPFFINCEVCLHEQQVTKFATTEVLRQNNVNPNWKGDEVRDDWNINIVEEERLANVVGKKTAKNIVEARKLAYFKNWDDFELNAKGVGKKTRRKLRDHHFFLPKTVL